MPRESRSRSPHRPRGGRSQSKERGGSRRHGSRGKSQPKKRQQEPAPEQAARIVPLTPPKKVSHAPIERPAAQLEAFDSSAVLASKYAFSAGAATGGWSDFASEDFLASSGLGGAAVYDLRQLEMQIREELYAATDDDLGVGVEDLDISEEVTGTGSPSKSESFTKGRGLTPDSRPSRASRASGASKAQGASPDFESRANRLNEKRKGVGVASRGTLEEAQLNAQLKLDAKRMQRPRPTKVSDMDGVLGWLDRHLDAATIAGYQRAAGIAPTHLEELDAEAEADESELEGMLGKWKSRAVIKARRRSESEAEGGEAGESLDERMDRMDMERMATRTGQSSKGGSPAKGGSPGGAASSGRQSSKEWLSFIQRELEEAPPEEVRVDVWARQRDLEQSVEQLIQRRDREAAERREQAAAARAARHASMPREASAWSDSEEEQEEDKEDAWLARPSMGMGWRSSTWERRPSLAEGEDESVHKFKKELVELEELKAIAKKKCFHAEHALRTQLGRKPMEAERRDDEMWIRAALKFKEADEALFVARSLTSWDD